MNLIQVRDEGDYETETIIIGVENWQIDNDGNVNNSDNNEQERNYNAKYLKTTTTFKVEEYIGVMYAN